METPKVSVVMSCYGEPLEWIQESIDSILNQTFRDFEFIIINDNPKRKELQEFLLENQKRDTRIKLISNRENIGLTKSLNIGLKEARGEYIARMDADDISLPKRFEKQVNFLDSHNSYGIVGSWLKDIGSKKAERRIPTDDTTIRLRWIIRPPFDHPATMMRTSVLKENGIKYDETLPYAQDMQLWYEMSKQCLFANLPEFLFLHRHNSQQVSVLHGKKQLEVTKSVRLKIMKDLMEDLGLGRNLPDKITLQYIKETKNKLKRTNKDKKLQSTYFIYYLYLSLHNYSTSSLAYFIFSGDFFSSSPWMRDSLRIIAKHIFPNKYGSSGVS